MCKGEPAKLRRVYPRTHGGTCLVPSMSPFAQGLSPHTRGNHIACAASRPAPGSIPAHTGEPRCRGGCRRAWRVYPRTHGGTVGRQVGPPGAEGLSPHTRGNPDIPGADYTLRGSIPAHTGEPLRTRNHLIPTRVYPRTHGGTGFPSSLVPQYPGLSPHTRGNRRSRAGGWPGTGSIPAHTGEPSSTRGRCALSGVYPRTHGGTWDLGWICTAYRGLSPHTRGNRPGSAPAAVRTGSIPAHTGEPVSMPGRRWSKRVYPRTHGGTAPSSARFEPRWGLSPHTRGNPIQGQFSSEDVRSIPAHTGEPDRAGCQHPNTRVYPRTHGGTSAAAQVTSSGLGLSPHTRGNPRPRWCAAKPRGSIPAHTGEPQGRQPPGQAGRVYPRTHGGTAFGPSIARSLEGLSPHTRGNRSHQPRPLRGQGSIPAHTGEPQGVAVPALVFAGLSPHTRGNQAGHLKTIPIPRSIPAHTGEPRQPAGTPASLRVYPRTHGGTRSSPVRAHRPQGLSPHTRGNRLPGRGCPERSGSIPAHTGEPP